MHSPRRHAGFTLFELMLVVSIIGILAAVALPAYSGYVKRAKISEGFQLAEPAQKAVVAYRDRWGVMPADNAAAGLPAPEAMRGNWVASVRVRDGAVIVSFQADKGDARPAGPLLLRPGVNRLAPTQALAWACGRHLPPDAFRVDAPLPDDALSDSLLPGGCRGGR